MSSPPEVLVVGNSVRYCAASAVRAGYRVTAIDAFGDLDTRASVAHFERAQGVGAEHLARAALRLHRRGRAPRRLIYCGGLDGRPDQLQRLERHFDVVGNASATLRAIACPRRFFELLAALAIPHPRVAFTRAPSIDAWLRKDLASSGGLAVRQARAGEACLHAGGYFQRRVQGRPVSALFAADGRDVRVLGYSRLSTEALPEIPFAFAGAISWPEPPGRLRESIRGYAQRLTRALGLRGLNGIDVMLIGAEERRSRPGLSPVERPAESQTDSRAGRCGYDRREPLFLELNARPCATLELHDKDHAGSCVRTHLAAAAGRLSQRSGSNRGRASRALVHGMRVIYPPQPLIVPPFDWPSWSSDHPAAGSVIAADAPLCTVHASGRRPKQVADRLKERAQDLLDNIHFGRSEAA